MSSGAMSSRQQAPTKDLIINADAYLMTMMDTELEAEGRGGDGGVHDWDHYSFKIRVERNNSFPNFT